MDESQKTVNGKNGEKNCFYAKPTLRHTSRKSGKMFVGILPGEIDGVRASKWNDERMIVFQSFTLQRAKGVNNSTQIRKRILFQLDCWNRGAFDELVQYMYNSAMVYIGKSCGNQNEEQRHIMFSNLVLKGKLYKAVRFVCDREEGGVLKPDELAEDCTGTINKTVISFLEEKYPI